MAPEVKGGCIEAGGWKLSGKEDPILVDTHVCLTKDCIASLLVVCIRNPE
jgi:hypothetical protein